jgi:hypothetical protein
MINPSDEQMAIINAIKDGNHVQVDAVAGSGKTTTILSLAHYNSDKTIVQITYNSDLKTEVREKQKQYSKIMKLDNLEIHNYHSFATTYYDKDAHNDIGLEAIIDQNMEPKRPLPLIKILSLDEIQDMNELYYRFILKILRDSNNYQNIQILTLGDKGQGLYEFKGADTRFLTLSNNIFHFSRKYPFKTLNLSTSYRITKEIAAFINDGMLGYQRLHAIKNGPQVQYIRHSSPYQVYKIISFKLVELIKSGQLNPDDIFILAPSVKSPRFDFVKLLENILVSNNIPCYVPTSETTSVNRETIKNKVIFSSYHQSKGRERKLIVVFGFDDEYFKYFAKDMDPEICPSTLYVAATRSTETLILVECSAPLPFLHYDHQIMQNEDHIEFEGTPLNLNIESQQPNQRPKTPPQNQHNTSPTDLIKFLDENVLIEVIKIIKDTNLFQKYSKSMFGTIVELSSSIKNQQYYNYYLTEEVSELNGLAIPAIFEERTSRKKMSIIREKVSKFLKNNPNPNHIYNRLLKDIDLEQENLSVSDYLKITNVYNSIKEKINFKVAQIRNYEWMNDYQIDALISNILLHIKEEEALDLEYEQEIIEVTDGDNKDVYDAVDRFTKSINLKNKIRFSAIIDAIDSKTVYEFKCTDTLEPEHYIQVVIYAWLWNKICERDQGPRVFKLLNIRTGEMQHLHYKEEAINKIMEKLLCAKFAKREVLTDQQFIDRCGKIAESMGF